MRYYWIQLEELDFKRVAWQRREWEAGGALGGVACWQGLCGLTFSTRIEYDPVVSKWPPDLYPSRFKGPVMSAEIEVLTAPLDSFSLILF